MLLRADAQQEYDQAMGRFPLQERAGVLRTPTVVYLISYFAAGDSLRSDTPDYFAQPERLYLHSAVAVQPLTLRQVDDYLLNVGESIAGLRAVLHDDPSLQKLASTPLILSILVKAYRGTSLEDLQQTDSAGSLRQHIFETYVRRMLQQRGGKTSYSLQQSMYWLAWLAQQMKRHNESVFYIEQLRVDWLPQYRLRLIYSTFCRLVTWPLHSLCYGLVFGLAAGLVGGLVDILAGFSNV